MTKKKTVEEVEVAFNQRGYTLVSEEYKGANSILDYRCSNGHKATITYGHLQEGRGCSSCTGNKKKTIEQVRELFTARGFKLLSTEYKNAQSPLNYLCSNGHQTKISFNDLQRGTGCAECSFKLKRKTVEEVKILFESKGFQLLSTKYKGAHSPLNYLCSNDHQSKISFTDLQQGKGCASCAKSGFNPNKSATLYYIRFQFEGNFYYKIGITNNTPSKRFQSERTPYTVIKETVYALGKDAYTQEQAILKKFSAYRYKGKPFLTMKGDTELFTKDVLQLDCETLQDFAA